MNVARIVMKAAIALLFLLVGSNAPYLSLSQSESVPTQVELCGVKLRPKVVEIVDQIEHYYKEPVQCELANLDDKGEAGYADATHGIPKIYVDTFTGRQELTIAHELLHIWLGIHGFATNPHVSFDKPNEIDGTRFRSALNIIYSDLQHRLIMIKLRAMGFDPDARFLRLCIEMMKSKPVFDRTPELLAFDIDRVDMNYKRVASEMRKWATAGGYGKQVELADRLEQIESQDNPTTTDAAVTTTRKCVNLIFFSTKRYFTHP